MRFVERHIDAWEMRFTKAFGRHAEVSFVRHDEPTVNFVIDPKGLYEDWHKFKVGTHYGGTKKSPKESPIGGVKRFDREQLQLQNSNKQVDDKATVTYLI